MANISIIDFQPEFAHHFKAINLKWIKQYFTPETEDLDTLDNPQKHLLDKGGSIFFAQVDNQIVGTCGLKKWSKTEYELVKMGVLDDFQGLHLGQLLGEKIIQHAKSQGCNRLFLESNSKLKPALSLYKKLGFKEVEYQDSRCGYQRCDVTMELFF